MLSLDHKAAAYREWSDGEGPRAEEVSHFPDRLLNKPSWSGWSEGGWFGDGQVKLCLYPGQWWSQGWGETRMAVDGDLGIGKNKGGDSLSHLYEVGMARHSCGGTHHLI